MRDVYQKIQQELPGLTLKKAMIFFEKVQHVTKQHYPMIHHLNMLFLN